MLSGLHTLSSRSGSHGNSLLGSLKPGDLRLLEPHLSRVSFKAGEIVADTGMPLERAYFPETAILSFQGSAAEQKPELGMIGAEGMIGWPLLLGCNHSTFLCVSRHGTGTALAIAARPLLEACHISSTLHGTLLRFVHYFMLQMACSIASGTDSVEQRVARWMLMLHDRHEGDQLALTHDGISAALNVRRASVTDCLHLLEGEGILKCTRGSIVVRDRPGLARIAGASYGAPEAYYSTQIARFGKSAAAEG
jgi:CRP-like cAMP-binding protein